MDADCRCETFKLRPIVISLSDTLHTYNALETLHCRLGGVENSFFCKVILKIKKRQAKVHPYKQTKHVRLIFRQILLVSQFLKYNP